MPIPILLKQFLHQINSIFHPLLLIFSRKSKNMPSSNPKYTSFSSFSESHPTYSSFQFQASFKNYSFKRETSFDYEKTEKPFMIRWKSGKMVDPRLLTMLECFREIYEEKQEFFKQIFPENQDEFVDVFDKVGAVVSTNKNLTRVQTMQRSLSLGSPRTPKQIDRFRVRTPVVALVPPGGGGDGSDQDGTGTGGFE